MKDLVPKNHFGAYCIIRQKKSEFFYDSQCVVEAIGITKDHFLSVFKKHPDKAAEMTQTIVYSYLEISSLIVN